jgi:WD40 repeat protein
VRAAKKLRRRSVGEISLWDAKTGELLKLFQRGHEGPIHAMAWLADGKGFVSLGEKDGTLCFWRLGADKPTRIHKGLPGAARFSPDSRFLVSRHDPRGVQIWETQTGRLRGTLLHLAGEPDQYLAVSAEGHYHITSQAWRHVVYVVQTESGQEILSSEDFEKRHRWHNDPNQVWLSGRGNAAAAQRKLTGARTWLDFGAQAGEDLRIGSPAIRASYLEGMRTCQSSLSPTAITASRRT